MQESIIGSTFTGTFRWLDRAAGKIEPMITGTAFVNAEATLLLDDAIRSCTASARAIDRLTRWASVSSSSAAASIGLCTAYYCARRGLRVTLVERNGARRDGCSFGNAGMLVPSHFVPLAAPGMVGARAQVDVESRVAVLREAAAVAATCSTGASSSGARRRRSTSAAPRRCCAT